MTICSSMGRQFLIVAACASIVSVASAQTSPVTSRDALKKLSVEELMNLEVTSVSKRNERVLDAAAAIFVINAEDIRRSGAASLTEVLRLAPNLQIAQVDPVQYAISARGFNNAIGNKLLVLVDGRTVYTPLFSGVFWDQQDLLLEDIERIEIISGPGATLWGANAVNGVINVITKSSAQTQGPLLAGHFGSQDSGASVRWGGAMTSAGSYRAYGKFSSWENTTRASGAGVLNDWRRAQVGARADWSAGRDSITVQGDAYAGESEHRGFAGSIELPPVEVSGVNVLARWNRQLRNRSDLQVQAYVDRSERTDIVLFQPKATIVDVELQHGIPVGRHRILWGAGYRHSGDDVAAGYLARFIPADRTLNWENVFVQDEVALGDKVQASGGIKFESNDYTGVEVLPSGRMTWKPIANHLLWGAVSRAVRAPSRLDREIFYPMNPPFIVVGGPNFQSEVANVFELGYRAQPLSRVSYSLTTFAHAWDNLRSGTNIPVMLENRIEGTVCGVEAWGTYQPMSFWTLNAGSTFLSEDLRLEPGSTDPTGVNNPNLRNDPDYQWMLRSSVDLPASVEFDLHVRGVGPLPNPAVPGYNELDVRVGWRAVRNLEIAITGHNLLHDRHPEFGAPATRGEIARSVSGKIRWGF